MKLGVAYNVFDGEELLERSIQSIRSSAAFVCVVYQTISNFGNTCHPAQPKVMERLKQSSLVDEFILYQPKKFSADEKQRLLSPSALPQEVGGPAEGISNQFFNELTKRELGRLACLKNGCTHFMSMDTDEFYIKEQLEDVMQLMEERGLEGTACKMRTYFKNGNYELLPFDETNWVPLIFVCKEDKPLLLACPYAITVDPTRRVSNIAPHKMAALDREVVEMHHLSFVRINIASKMQNVSNRDNHDQAQRFLQEFSVWEPSMGVIHPHPHGRRTFRFVSLVPNIFDVDISSMCLRCFAQTAKRCSSCKTAAYCSAACQKEDWSTHKTVCRKK